jgi:small subunit ribosomal protein S16
MIKLRLKRFGKKREASFRLVACNSTSRRDGRPLEELGFYNPRTKETRLNTEAIRARLAQGAQPTDTVLTLLEQLDSGDPRLELVELGLQHEQQHQELLLMDLLDGFSRNPLEPIYAPQPEARFQATSPAANSAENLADTPSPTWLQHGGGLVEIGHPGGAGGTEGLAGSFHFDNEAPRHRQWLQRLQQRRAAACQQRGHHAQPCHRRQHRHRGRRPSRQHHALGQSLGRVHRR